MNRAARRSAARHPGNRNSDCRAPMLVMRGLRNTELETRERMAVEAFSLGYATHEHFDTLVDMHGVLLLAGSTSEKRAPAMHYARHTLGPVIQSIRERYNRTQKLGCSADELKVLRGFVSMYRDFWLKQPLELYQAACEELQRHYNRLAARRQEATA